MIITGITLLHFLGALPHARALRHMESESILILANMQANPSEGRPRSGCGLFDSLDSLLCGSSTPATPATPEGRFKVKVQDYTKIYEVEVEGKDTILKVKTKIEDMSGIPVDKQRLIHNKKSLDDLDAKVEDFKVQENDTITVVLLMSFQLRVKTPFIDIILDVNSGSKIFHIKQVLSEIFPNLGPKLMILKRDGNELEDDNALRDYGISSSGFSVLLLAPGELLDRKRGDHIFAMSPMADGKVVQIRENDTITPVLLKSFGLQVKTPVIDIMLNVHGGTKISDIKKTLSEIFPNFEPTFMILKFGDTELENSKALTDYGISSPEFEVHLGAPAMLLERWDKRYIFAMRPWRVVMPKS